MQEKTTLKLSRNTAEMISENPREINHYLLLELKENLEQIRLMVSGYFFLDRKRIYDLTIDEGSVKINASGNGMFIAKFTVGILDGCADIDRSQLDSMTIGMSLDLQKGEIFLSGENLPERQPDDF